MRINYFSLLSGNTNRQNEEVIPIFLIPNLIHLMTVNLSLLVLLKTKKGFSIQFKSYIQSI